MEHTMSQTQSQVHVPNATLWIGRVLSAVPALFLFVDGAMKLVKPAVVVETTVQLGYPEGVITGLGIVLLLCTALYAIPQTAFIGAILLTGYLGGAVATHVRVGDIPGYALMPRGELCSTTVFYRDLAPA